MHQLAGAAGWTSICPTKRWEREREGERECVCVWERECVRNKKNRVCNRERERENERVCVREIQTGRVREWESERVRETVRKCERPRER